MCKLFAITDLSNVKLTSKLIKNINSVICKTQDDGFGYAVLGSDNQIGGERTLNPEEFVPFSGDPKSTVTGALPIVTVQRDVFGTIDRKKPKALVAHARYSTNSVSLPNTHPFYNGDVALIHNGVVSDLMPGGVQGLDTNNDTEILYKQWLSGGMDKVAEYIGGYYAFITLEKDGLMHVVKDDTASLSIAWCETIRSFIIATDTSIIQDVAKLMKWKCEFPEHFTDNTHAIFEGNKIVSHETFTPKGKKQGMSATEKESLGYRSSYDFNDYSDTVPSYRDTDIDRYAEDFDDEFDRDWRGVIVGSKRKKSA